MVFLKWRVPRQLTAPHDRVLHGQSAPLTLFWPFDQFLRCTTLSTLCTSLYTPFKLGQEGRSNLLGGAAATISIGVGAQPFRSLEDGVFDEWLGWF